MVNDDKNRKFIPALSYRWLNFLYDPLIRVAMRERRFKSELIRQAKLKPGHRILDVGCGTGTLVLMIKQMYPETEIVGLDVDPDMLKRARAKALAAGVEITFAEGSATDLPYGDGSFDRVFSSLMLHHLDREQKRKAVAECYRVLFPGGQLHVADLGPPKGIYSKLMTPLVSRHEEAADNMAGLLPRLFQEAGFRQVQETASYTTFFGTVCLYQAFKLR